MKNLTIGSCRRYSLHEWRVRMPMVLEANEESYRRSLSKATSFICYRRRTERWSLPLKMQLSWTNLEWPLHHRFGLVTIVFKHILTVDRRDRKLLVYEGGRWFVYVEVCISEPIIVCWAEVLLYVIDESEIRHSFKSGTSDQLSSDFVVWKWFSVKTQIKPPGSRIPRSQA